MNIFISGIGGAGLGPLAEIALDAGYQVFGSDINHSLQTEELEARGVEILYEQTAENIAKVHAQNPIDWFVYTSSLPGDSAELKFVKENHIRSSKRDEFLAEFIVQRNLRLLAVAGTHGKTTTTAMLVWVFHRLGRPISYSVGATLSFGASGRYDPASRFFVYEADEYDRNFLQFTPARSLIVSVDYDHADIYPTRESYDSAFQQFIDQSGQTILWQDAAKQLDLEITDENSTILDGHVSRNEINLAGEKMRANAKLVLEMLRDVLDDFDEALVKKILADFPGTSRRFEKLVWHPESILSSYLKAEAPDLIRGQPRDLVAESSGSLYTDYAHAPAEIAATLEKAREIVGETELDENLRQKIVVIYQPHQNLRQTELVKNGGYNDSFAAADKIYWTPTYLVRGDLVDGAPAILTPEKLIGTLSEKSREIAEPAELDEDLWQKIQQHLANGDLVIIMGAGPIDGWVREKI